MPDRELRERAAQLILRESRYCLPFWARVFLVGVAAGLTIAFLVLPAVTT